MARLVKCPHCGRTFFLEEEGGRTGRVQVVFDGGKGPKGAYGTFRIRWPDGRLQQERRTFEAGTTSNEAEYRTLLAALDRLLAEVEDPGALELEVLGDSQLVVNQVNGTWKARDPRMLRLRDEVRRRLERFGRVEVRWHGREESVDRFGH